MAVKAPKNVSIKLHSVSNTSAKFEITWKHGEDNYDGQELYFYERYKKTNDSVSSKRYDKKRKVALSKSATSKTVSVDFSDYPPTGTKRLCTVRAEVRAKKDGKWSDYGKTGTYDIHKPNPPKGLAKPAPLDGDYSNRARYQWSGGSNKDKFYYCYHYQVAEIENYSANTLDEVKWKSNIVSEDKNYRPSGGNGNKAFSISSFPPAGQALTQFFRVRAYGPQGYSSWVTSWHPFANGPQATDVEATAQETSSGGYLVTVQWKVDNNKYSTAVDKVVVQYVNTEPEVVRTVDGDTVKFQLVCPTSPQPSWQDRSVQKDTSSYDSLTFSADGKPGANQVMFVRVNTLHDTTDSTTYGETQIIKDGDKYGYLTSPVITNTDYNPTTHMVNISITNESLTNSFTAIYISYEGSEPKIIGIIPKGRTSDTFATPEDIPETEAPRFSAQTYVADYSPATPAQSGVTYYTLDNILMSSEQDWSEGGAIALAPNLTISNPEQGVILAKWDWSWREAQSAELSWSTKPYAWESTDAPSTFTIKNTNAGQWRISGLDFDTYYVRVRLIKSSDNYETYGLYSEMKQITLTASDPPTPVLTVDPAVIGPHGETSCYWAYMAEDGSTQMQADIVEVTFDQNNNPVYSLPVATTSSAQHITLLPESLGWHSGETHNIAVRTVSSYMTMSQYSNFVAVTVANPVTASVTLGDGFELAEDADEESQYPYELKRFPFSINVIGAGDDGSTSMYITRAYGLTDYIRPDEKESSGFEGEAIAVYSDRDDGTIVVSDSDAEIVGSFDDGEVYTVTVIAKDKYGQTGEASTQFRVNWNRKAHVPSAEITVYYDLNVALITPIVEELPYDFYLENGNVYIEADSVDPEDIGLMSFDFDSIGNLIYTYDDRAVGDFQLINGDLHSRVGNGDYFDIYRLTADKPELVYSGLDFGETVVDPYPTIGKFGGYRIVYRSKYHDCITEDGLFAWTDYGAEDGATLDKWDMIIDFGEDQVSIPYNIDISHQWEKDFVQTIYLGGAIQGDWNPGVSHTISAHTDVAVGYDSATFRLMRRLAEYTGYCHVRTPDGSSFYADVKVSEDRNEKMINKIASFSLDITRVDQIKEDGILYSDWSEGE